MTTRMPIVETTLTSATSTSSPLTERTTLTPAAPRRRYKNNLLPAIGFLDLTNALDFPANVWNMTPALVFAQVLMGLGGSICALSTAFACWDLYRGMQNIRFLRGERAHLKEKEANGGLSRLEKAWLDINFREIGWEIIDRVLLDISMCIGGILVGAGTLMAIRGNIDAVFQASNLLSGYIGNSIIAAYALLNVAWSVFMWMRARKHAHAVANAREQIPGPVLRRLRHHSRRHKLYAALTSVTIVVSGVGSEISATLWPGYVVLIPAIISSVLCNFFWRLCVNYNRFDIRDSARITQTDPLERLSRVDYVMRTLQSEIEKREHGEDVSEKDQPAASQHWLNLLHEFDLVDDFHATLNNSDNSLPGTTFPKPGVRDSAVSNLPPPVIIRTAKQCIAHAKRHSIRDEERFLLELLDCYLCAAPAESHKEETNDG